MADQIFWENLVKQGKDLYNIDAEASVLSAMLANQQVLEDLLERLSEEDFYRAPHKVIFSAIRRLKESGRGVDQIELIQHLEDNQTLIAAGGKSFILDICNNPLALINWEGHSDILKRLRIQRDLYNASGKIGALALEGSEEITAVIEQSERILFQATNQKVESNFKSIQELVTEAYDDLALLADSSGQVIGVETGYTDLDKHLAGLRPGQLVILAARPAIGKTSFALNLAVNAAKAGNSVAFFSLEMSAQELMQRVLCAEASVDLARARKGQINEEDWTPLIEASGTLSQLDFWVDDTPGTTVLEIRAKARRQMRHKEKGLIIIDYLQLMNPATRAENRNVEVAEMSRALKILAKDLGMPIIALSQLSREVERRKDKRPMLSDLRESGSIEQDADIVMFLDRSVDEREASHTDRPDLGIAEVIVAKNRSGPVGSVQLAFLAHITKFANLSRRTDSY